MIAIGTDHIGFEYKETIINYIKELGSEVLDWLEAEFEAGRHQSRINDQRYRK